MKQSISSISRRQWLSLGGSGIATALAGCTGEFANLIRDDDGSDGSDKLTERERFEKFTDREEVIRNQPYEIPPVKELHPYTTYDQSSDPTPGVASVIWAETNDFEPTNRNDEYQFADELTFELFVYGESPTESEEVKLTKIGEKTTHLGQWSDAAWTDDGTKIQEKSGEPYPSNFPLYKHVYFEYDVDKVPKNQQIRFRLRITNNRTGKQEFAHDQGLVYYIRYNDGLQFLYRDGISSQNYPNDPYPYNDYPKSEENSRIIEETNYGYKFVQRVKTEFPSKIGESVPYSVEAGNIRGDPNPPSEEMGSYDQLPPYYFKSDTIQRGDIVDIPRDSVELAQDWYDQLELRSKEDIHFRQTVPEEYDYYGRDTYDVLDNPLLTKLADNINQAMEDYSVNNHYARIQSAIRLIQGFDYSEELGSKYRLPEEYFSETSRGDCVSHTMNLSWLFYHLGYASGLVYMNRDEDNHIAPAIGVPDETINGDFPEYIQDESPVTTVGKLDRYDGYNTDSLGDLNWLYVEATSSHPIREGSGPNQLGVPMGRIPLEYNEISIEAILEPEDPWFETGVSNTITR